jgi:hypothetical protein
MNEWFSSRVLVLLLLHWAGGFVAWQWAVWASGGYVLAGRAACQTQVLAAPSSWHRVPEVCMTWFLSFRGSPFCVRCTANQRLLLRFAFPKKSMRERPGSKKKRFPS